MAAATDRVVLLLGDSFLIEEKTNELAKKVRASAGSDLQVQTFYLADTPLDDVLRAARTLPFLVAGQIFHVRELARLKKADLESLEKYLQHPADAAWIFLEAPELPKNHGLSPLMERLGKVFVLEGKSGNPAVRRYLQDKIKRSGKLISPRGIALLEEEAGEMPSFLDSMVERLIAYAGDVNEISEEMVQTFAENWAEGDVFQLVNAIVDRKPDQALRHFRLIFQTNDREIGGLVGAVHNRIRKLWKASLLLSRGYPQSEVIKQCGVSTRQAPFFFRQLKQLPRKRLEAALEGLFDFDWKMKSGRGEAVPALESWILNLTT